MLRESLIRLATAHPEFRKHIVPLLREAKEFTNKKQLDQYLRDHPAADKTKHTVQDGGKDAPKKDEESKGEKVKGVDPEKARAKVQDLPEKAKERLKAYDLDLKVLDDDDLNRAIDIATKIADGLDNLPRDVCKVSPPVCAGNLGLTRDKMPQIPGDMPIKAMLKATNKDGTPDEATRAKGKAAVEAGGDPDDSRTMSKIMLDIFKEQGVKITSKSVPAGKLKATQSEILAKKTIKFADQYLAGEFTSIGQQIVISKDGHILDGHHRWAALLTADPNADMECIEVDLNMKDMLDQADGFPGVYREDMDGNPVPMTDEVKKKKAEFKKKNKGKGKKDDGGGK